MFDPFDAFDPIDPVPAPEPAPDVDDVERLQVEADIEETGSDAPGPGEGRPDRALEGSLQPDFQDLDAPDDASGSPRGNRRWTASARRPLRIGSADRPPRREDRKESTTTTGAPSSPTDTSGELPDPSTTHPPAPRAGSATLPSEPMDSVPADLPGEAVPASLLDVAALRAVAVPELRRAAERLRVRGHYAVLADELDADEPAVAVLFRPDPGPLAPVAGVSRDPARFVLRLEPGAVGARVVAGFSGPKTDGSFTPLEGTPVRQVNPAWVSHRFIEFVQQHLTTG